MTMAAPPHSGFAAPSSYSTDFEDPGPFFAPLPNDNPHVCFAYSHNRKYKRRMNVPEISLLEDGAPKAKRRVDRMSARLRNFHISPVKNDKHQNWQDKQRQESFQEIEDRLDGDSTDEEMDDDLGKKEEGDGNTEQKLKLSKELRDYIRRSYEKSVIIDNPVSEGALVPYVPRNYFDEPSMCGRISEITEEEAQCISSQLPAERPAVISYVDEVHSEDSEGENGITEVRDHGSLTILELDESDDLEMDTE